MSLEETNGYKNGSQFAEEVVGALENAGIDVMQPIALSFFLYLPNKDIAETVATLLRDESYDVDVDKSADDNSAQWLCWCNKTLTPNKETLKETGTLFLNLEKEHNGDFDGWETNPYV